MAAKTWTCRRSIGGVKCGAANARVKQRCVACGGIRPKRRTPAHRAILSSMPYEAWLAAFGDRCNVCGAEQSPTRKLDRDHDHGDGRPRGLLCHRCNRQLPAWVTPAWLRAAADYLEREPMIDPLSLPETSMEA